MAAAAAEKDATFKFFSSIVPLIKNDHGISVAEQEARLATARQSIGRLPSHLRNDSNWPPNVLHAAISCIKFLDPSLREDFPSIISTLLRKVAQCDAADQAQTVQQVDGNGRNCVHSAVRWGDLDTIERLHAIAPDAFLAVDNYGFTAFTLALKQARDDRNRMSDLTLPGDEAIWAWKKSVHAVARVSELMRGQLQVPPPPPAQLGRNGSADNAEEDDVDDSGELSFSQPSNAAAANLQRMLFWLVSLSHVERSGEAFDLLEDESIAQCMRSLCCNVLNWARQQPSYGDLDAARLLTTAVKWNSEHTVSLLARTQPLTESLMQLAAESGAWHVLALFARPVPGAALAADGRALALDEASFIRTVFASPQLKGLLRQPAAPPALCAALHVAMRNLVLRRDSSSKDSAAALKELHDSLNAARTSPDGWQLAGRARSSPSAIDPLACVLGESIYMSNIAAAVRLLAAAVSWCPAGEVLSNNAVDLRFQPIWRSSWDNAAPMSFIPHLIARYGLREDLQNLVSRLQEPVACALLGLRDSSGATPMKAILTQKTEAVDPRRSNIVLFLLNHGQTPDSVEEGPVTSTSTSFCRFLQVVIAAVPPPQQGGGDVASASWHNNQDSIQRLAMHPRFLDMLLFLMQGSISVAHSKPERYALHLITAVQEAMPARMAEFLAAERQQQLSQSLLAAVVSNTGADPEARRKLFGLLVEHQASVDLTGSYVRSTPLMCAVEKMDKMYTKRLVKAGARALAVSADNLTSFELLARIVVEMGDGTQEEKRKEEEKKKMEEKKEDLLQILKALLAADDVMELHKLVRDAAPGGAAIQALPDMHHRIARAWAIFTRGRNDTCQKLADELVAAFPLLQHYSSLVADSSHPLGSYLPSDLLLLTDVDLIGLFFVPLALISNREELERKREELRKAQRKHDKERRKLEGKPASEDKEDKLRKLSEHASKLAAEVEQLESAVAEEEARVAPYMPPPAAVRTSDAGADSAQSAAAVATINAAIAALTTAATVAAEAAEANTSTATQQAVAAVNSGNEAAATTSGARNVTFARNLSSGAREGNTAAAPGTATIDAATNKMKPIPTDWVQKDRDNAPFRETESSRLYRYQCAGQLYVLKEPKHETNVPLMECEMKIAMQLMDGLASHPNVVLPVGYFIFNRPTGPSGRETRAFSIAYHLYQDSLRGWLQKECKPIRDRDGQVRQTEPALGTRVKLLQDVAQGMLFIQSMARQAGTRIIHRDLHSDNVLIESVGGGEPRARVHDFGHARCFDHTKHMSVKHMSTAGMAPEMLQKDAVHNEKVDIYQFGCLMYEVLSMRQPFERCTPSVIIGMYKQRESLLKSMQKAQKRRQGDDPYPEMEAAQQVLAELWETDDDDPQVVEEARRLVEAHIRRGHPLSDYKPPRMFMRPEDVACGGHPLHSVANMHRLVDLMECCLADAPNDRPAKFEDVLEELQKVLPPYLLEAGALRPPHMMSPADFQGWCHRLGNQSKDGISGTKQLLAARECADYVLGGVGAEWPQQGFVLAFVQRSASMSTPRMYDTRSVVDLVQLLRNLHEHPLNNFSEAAVWHDVWATYLPYFDRLYEYMQNQQA